MRARYADVAVDRYTGRPIPAVVVAVFDEGTTTPIGETLYAGPTGLAVLANPFVGGADGEVEFWLDQPAAVDVRWAKGGFATETHTVVVNAPAVPLTEKGAANGVATLGADSKVPAGQLPALAINETFVVNSQAAMLALVAERGDMAVRTDLAQTFMLAADAPTVLGSWVALETPSGTSAAVAAEAALRVAGDAAEATARAAAIAGLDGTYVAIDVLAAGVAATDTAALQAAITAAIAGNRRELRIKGAFKVNGSLGVLDRGVALVGDGEYRSTSIEFSGATSLFELGTDNGHPHNDPDYDGLASGFRLENIALTCAASVAVTALDNGQGNYAANRIAIRDWRGGDIVLRNVFIEGFDIPFWGIQSDVNRWDHVTISKAHSGIYLGPRSDQLTCTALYVLLSDRALDLDSVNGHRYIGPQFVGNGAPGTNPIRIRSAWAAGSNGIVFEDPWFEHLQGYAAADLEAFVEIGVGDSVVSKDINFRNPTILVNAAADPPPRKKYLVTMDRGDNVAIENPQGQYWFNLDKMVEFTGSTSPSVLLLARNSVTHTTVFQTVNNGSGSPSVTNLEWGALGLAGGVNYRGGSITAGDLIAVAGRVKTGSGATGSRPSAVTSGAGSIWFDTTIGKLLISDGATWLEYEDGDSDLLLIGEANMKRRNIVSNGASTGSTTMRLGYFTAKKSETVTQFRVISGGTAAGATPSLVQIVAYSVAANGDLTLIGSTTNDTSLLAAPTTAYTKAASASFAKVRGQRYASGLLVVTAATAPTMLGTSIVPASEMGQSPRIGGLVSGQASVPASVAAASVADNQNIPYVVWLP